MIRRLLKNLSLHKDRIIRIRVTHAPHTPLVSVAFTLPFFSSSRRVEVGGEILCGLNNVEGRLQ